MAWRHHTHSLPLVTSLYYSHPEATEAYQVPQEYWFGSELIAAPFTAPAHPETGLARQTVWLPEGEWFHFFSGEHVRSGWQTQYGRLEDIPVFARAGAIVPLAPQVGWGGVENPAELDILVFAGADNRFELFEDDGASTQYRNGAFAVTAFSQAWRGNEMTFTISPAQGDLGAIPVRRSYRILLRGFTYPISCQAFHNGEAISIRFEGDVAVETLRFEPVGLEPGDEFRLILEMAEEWEKARRERSLEKLRKYLQAFRLNSLTKQAIENNWQEIATGKKLLRSFNELSDAQLAVLEGLLT
jgi:hypothetical protein